MSKFSCRSFSFLKDTERNGGYGEVGDGNLTCKLVLEKDGNKITLEDGEITKLIKTLSLLNPKLR